LIFFKKKKNEPEIVKKKRSFASECVPHYSHICTIVLILMDLPTYSMIVVVVVVVVVVVP